MWSSCLSLLRSQVCRCTYGTLFIMLPCPSSDSLPWRVGLSVLSVRMRQTLLPCSALGCQGLYGSASTCVHVVIRADINPVLFSYSDFTSRVMSLTVRGGRASIFFLFCKATLFILLQGHAQEDHRDIEQGRLVM